MKYRVTRKDICESTNRIIRIGYCNAQYLFKGLEPFAYSTRAEGWACDYYDLGSGVVASEGYAPIGVDVDYNITKEYDDKACEVACDHSLKYEDQIAQIANLRREWLDRVLNEAAYR